MTRQRLRVVHTGLLKTILVDRKGEMAAQRAAAESKQEDHRLESKSL